MAFIYLGNLSLTEIEKRYGFEFTEAERRRLHELWHQNAEFEDGESGWHMFDIPQFLVVSDDAEGQEVLEMFKRHEGEMTGCFRGGYA